jgi:hypothetical protein
MAVLFIAGGSMLTGPGNLEILLRLNCKGRKEQMRVNPYTDDEENFIFFAVKVGEHHCENKILRAFEGNSWWRQGCASSHAISAYSTAAKGQSRIHPMTQYVIYGSFVATPDLSFLCSWAGEKFVALLLSLWFFRD